MERKRNIPEPIWIIRWLSPYGMECKSGTREEVEAYAREKAKERKSEYLIF